MGIRVVAIDTMAEKKQLCLDLGSETWIDFKTKDLVKANRKRYAQAVDYLRPGGTLMAVGILVDATLEASIFWTVIKDSIETIDIAASGKMNVKYGLKGLLDLQQVYNDLEKGKVAGRVVLDASK
ncbi:hypothetical protein V8E55_008059 [Tylopilus felleus]